MTQVSFKAISPKNQKTINRILKLHMTYELYNRARDNAYDNGDEKAYNKLNNQCERQWDKLSDLVYELPKTEQKRIWKYLLETIYQ